MRWIASLLADDAPPEQRAAAEAALGSSERGRQLIAALSSFDPPPADTNDGADEARVARIMATVSVVAAGDLPRIAESVLDAWGAPAFREALRRDPAGTLRAREVILPEGLRVRVVGPADARVPSSDQLELPLPLTGAPAIDRLVARQELARSEFAWLFGTVPEADTRRAASSARWPRDLPRRALAFGALAAMVTMALWTVRGAPDGGGDLSGTAVGTPAAAALLLALALVAGGLTWWSRRR